MTVFNLLLLSERGVGKTTFINSLINYFRYGNIDAAVMCTAIVAAPISFSIIDANNKDVSHSLKANLDGIYNVKTNTRTKEYLVPINGHQLRLIDTPGFVMSKHEQNQFKNIFQQLCHLQELHAVCFFLRSSDLQLVSVENLIRQTMANLDVAAVKNFIFIFTEGRKVTFYPAVAKSALRKIVHTIKSTSPEINIPLHNDNMYCVDNEAFVHLVAYKCGISLSSKDTYYTESSWNTSLQECKRLIDYVSKLKPFQLPVDGAVEAIQTLLKENSPRLRDIIESNSQNLEKYEKLVGRLAEAMKSSIQKTSVPSCENGQQYEEQERPTEKMSKSSKPHHGSYNAILTDDDSDSAKPVSTKDEGRRGDGKEHHSTSRNPISRTQDDQQKLTPPAADMQKELASISDNVNNQENLMQNVYETMKKQQENVKQFMEKIGLLLESNEMENIDTLKKQLKSFLSDSEDGRNKHHQTEHSEHNESETISKDLESATQKESPELDYKVTYTYRTNNSEDDKSSKPRTDDARPEYPSPERTYNDPREPRNYDARYHHEEDKRLAEAFGRRNHRSNFFPRSTSPGRYQPTTERKSHRRDHRTHYSPRRHRRRSESYDSSDRDFRRSSRRHANRYTDESESYDADDNPSRNRTRAKSYKDYDSSDDRHKKSRHVRNKSSRRRRSSDEDTKREKKSHRRHHKEKRSSRRHRSSSESYDSDDDESRRSFSSGTASSARSFDSRSSVKRSKGKTGRSRDSEQHRSTRTEKKSRQEVKESSRRHGHRSRSDISDSDERDSRKWSQRSGNKHSRRKDKSDCDSDGGHTTRNGLKKSKNQTQSNKKHDSVGDRPVKSSKSAHSVPKDKKKTGDSNDTRPAKSSKSGNTKDEKSATLGKSDLVDPHSSQSSTREPNSNERESEKQPNKNKENCDSLDKQSVKSSNKDTVQVSKPKNKIRSKSE
ncbi:hypothetical protein Zmor_015082 [Zophobas morio]|uniref:G domain-containing protein n=1 Tax=Zophobas morio TaxID=2755281 RepID=A0AA38IHA5_9CUCU|nr:hypothetical protein Zmor_015082 [Zophobas morio]